MGTGKPIRYFAFSHHHPHYIGGIRPFVASGAEILSQASNADYINEMLAARRELRPDRLEKSPRRAHLSPIIGKRRVITDGNYRVEMHHIGYDSAHSDDYVVFYFPKEKVLFEGDLAWVGKDASATKLAASQVGLVNSVKALGLEVDTVLQSWPLVKYSVKTVIPFADIE